MRGNGHGTIYYAKVVSDQLLGSLEVDQTIQVELATLKKPLMSHVSLGV
jgi:hypothetical protein